MTIVITIQIWPGWDDPHRIPPLIPLAKGHQTKGTMSSMSKPSEVMAEKTHTLTTGTTEKPLGEPGEKKQKAPY